MLQYNCGADIVVVGVGERMTERLDPALMKHLRSKRISVELMDTVSSRSRAKFSTRK